MQKFLFFIIFGILLSNCEESDNSTSNTETSVCSENYFLLNRSCVQDCPNEYITNVYTFKCQKCEDNETFYWMNIDQNRCQQKEDKIQLSIEYVNNPFKFKILWKPIKDYQEYGIVNTSDIRVEMEIEKLIQNQDYKFIISGGGQCSNGYNCANLTIEYSLGVSIPKYTQIKISVGFYSLQQIQLKSQKFSLSEYKNEIPISQINIFLERSSNKNPLEFLIGINGARDANEAEQILETMKIVELGNEIVNELNFSMKLIHSDYNSTYWNLLQISRNTDTESIDYLVLQFEEGGLYKMNSKIAKIQSYSYQVEQASSLMQQILKYSIWGLQGFTVLVLLITSLNYFLFQLISKGSINSLLFFIYFQLIFFILLLNYSYPTNIITYLQEFQLYQPKFPIFNFLWYKQINFPKDFPVHSEFIMNSPYFLTNMLEVLCSFVIVIFGAGLIALVNSLLKKLNYYLYSTIFWRKFYSLINYNILHLCGVYIYCQGLILAIYNINYLHPFSEESDQFMIINFWSSCAFLLIGFIYLLHLSLVTNVGQLMKRELLIHEQLIKNDEQAKSKIQRFIRWVSSFYYYTNQTYKLESITMNEIIFLNARKNSQLAQYYYIFELIKLAIISVLIVVLDNYPFSLAISIQGVLILFFVGYAIIRPQKRFLDLLIQLLSQLCIIIGFGCITTISIFLHYNFTGGQFPNIRKQLGYVLFYSMVALSGLQLASQFFSLTVYFVKIKKQRLFGSTIVKSTNQKLQIELQQQQQNQHEVQEFITDQNESQLKKDSHLKYLADQQQSIEQKNQQINKNQSHFGSNLSAWAFKDSQIAEKSQERKKWKKVQDNKISSNHYEDIDPLQVILNHNDKKKSPQNFKVQGITHFDIPSPNPAYFKENQKPDIIVDLPEKNEIPEAVQHHLFNLKKKKKNQTSKLEEESPLKARNANI